MKIETQCLLLRGNQITETNHKQIGTIHCNQCCWRQGGGRSGQGSFTKEVTRVLNRERSVGIFQVDKSGKGISGQVA